MTLEIVEYDEVTSTLDVAHQLAGEGAESGTIVVANSQTAGRGRMGRTWRSAPGAGLWLTLIERPRDATALDVLSLRAGLALAPALDAFAGAPVGLKWPNDLYLRDAKLGGILIEARWRDGRPEWVAIGVGINLRAPADESRAIGLTPGVTRDALLAAIASPLRAAAAALGPLSADEWSAFAARDIAIGRRCIEPAIGTVAGIDASGALLVRLGSPEHGTVTAVRAGSLVLEEAT
jgi:BirA family biotin operon repressor/biotin-[acetyl-CoA-carboxylase] ligase